MREIAIYFVMFLVIIISAEFIYELANVIRIRWIMHVGLLFLIIWMFKNFSEGERKIASILILITFCEFIWITWMNFRISSRIGLIQAIDSDYSTVNCCFGAQCLIVCSLIWQLPINWIGSKFNYQINVERASMILYGIFFLATLILYYWILKGYKVIKKQLKIKGIVSKKEIFEMKFIDKIYQKEDYVEQILIRMQKRKFIYKLNLREGIYIYKNLYNIIYEGIENENSQAIIYDNIPDKYKNIGFADIYGYLYKKFQEEKNIIPKEIVNN